MAEDRKFFNCSQKHEVDYMAKKFNEPKEDVVLKLKELCKCKKIFYSTHKTVEQHLIDSGFTRK